MEELRNLRAKWVARIGVAGMLIGVGIHAQSFSAIFEWTREAMFNWTIHAVFSHLLNL